jgi:hypothetical protein
MPNWTVVRLREKARGDRSEALFRRIDSRRELPRMEAIADFLKRGGKIKIIPQKNERR